jgi:hypothetical protein
LRIQRERRHENMPPAARIATNAMPKLCPPVTCGFSSAVLLLVPVLLKDEEGEGDVVGVMLVELVALGEPSAPTLVVGVGLMVGVCVGVSELVGVTLAVLPSETEGEAVPDTDGDEVGVSDGVCEGVSLMVGVGVPVALSEGDDVDEEPAVAVKVGDDVADPAGVLLLLALGEALAGAREGVEEAEGEGEAAPTSPAPLKKSE